MNPQHPPGAEHVPLRQVLSDLAADLQRQAPPSLSLRAQQALAAAHPLRQARPAVAWRHWLGWTGTAAIATTLLATVLLLQMPGPRPMPSDRRLASGFVSVASPERWDRLLAAAADPAEGTTWVVRSDMPAERLAALGLPFDPTRAGNRVPTELLLHATGEVLAVRLIQP